MLVEPANPAFHGHRLGVRSDKARRYRRVVDVDDLRQILPPCDSVCERHERVPIGSRLRRVFLQELQHGDFVPPQRGGGMLAAGALRRQCGRERCGEALEVGPHQSGVDVVFAAHGARVAEALRHRVDRPDHVALGFALALRRPEPEKLPRREHRARPGPEVLRREIAPGDFAKIGVHVVRRDGLALAGRVDVFEQLLPRQVLTLLDDAGEAPVGDRHGVIDSALAAEAEEHFRALDLDVTVAQGREAEGAVLAGVLVVAYADQRLVEQHDHGGEDLAPGQVARAQVALDALADLREDFAEFEHAPELGFVARFAVARMVAVLFSSARVARRRLDVAFGVRAYPDVGPGGGNREGVDSLALGLVRDALAVRCVENPALSRALAPDALEAVGDVVESGAEGRLAMLIDARRDHRSVPAPRFRSRCKSSSSCVRFRGSKICVGRFREWPRYLLVKSGQPRLSPWAQPRSALRSKLSSMDIVYMSIRVRLAARGVASSTTR